MNVKRLELLILVLFLILNLRVLTWYSGDNLLIRGDFRPPINSSAFLQNSLHLWNEVDFGLPSVYTPRLIDPFISSVLLFENAGISPQISEILAIYLTYVLVSVLAYVFVKLITGDLLASTIGAIFFITNVHLVIDMEQSAIGFAESAAMIMPSIVMLLLGLKRRSTMLVGLSAILFVLNYGSFPNYRNMVLCVIGLFVTFIFAYMKDRSIPVKKYIAAFALFVSAASIWAVTVLATTSNYLFNAFSQVSNTNYGGQTYFIDVLRLITKWSYYDVYAGRSYTAYHDVYSNNIAMIVITLVPVLLAFGSILASKRRKLCAYFCVVAVIGLVLTSGVIPVGDIKFLLVFRESVNWTFLVILPFSVLIGLSASGLAKRVKRISFKIIAVCAIVGILFVSAYPLFSGDVTDNWLTAGAKGSAYPNYMVEAKQFIDNRYWTLLLPQRITYLVYDFPQGKLVCANIYPMLTSFPYISGQGTEYVANPNRQVLIDLYNMPMNTTDTYKYLGKLGIKYIMVENDIVEGNLGGAPGLDLPIIQTWAGAVLYDNPYAVGKLYISNDSAFDWVQESPTKYNANINATMPFDVVLLENFESNWKVKVNGHLIPEISHMMYNGFANEWSVNETGSLQLEIFYAPQDSIVPTALLSVGATVLCLLILLILRSHNKPIGLLHRCSQAITRFLHWVASRLRKRKLLASSFRIGGSEYG